MEIKIERQVDRSRLVELGVFDWSIWTKDISEFPWTYDTKEICYLLAGEAIITPDGGNPVTIGVGDLVTFPRGMSCTWKVTAPIRKHYLFN
jgi:uncharacterized protein